MRQAGLFQPPPEMSRAVVAWVQAVYAGHVLDRVLKVLEVDPQDGDAEFLQRAVEEDLEGSYRKVRAYKTKASTTLAVDVDGWVYLEKERARRKAMGADLTQGDIEARLRSHGWAGGLTVVLDFVGKTSRGGQFDPNTKTLEVGVRDPDPHTVTAYRKARDEMARTTMHEMRHVAQFLLRDLLGLRNEAGVPDRQIRDPLLDARGRPQSPAYWSKEQPHALRDIEFQPRLGDEVVRFLREVRDVPEPLWRDFLRAWVGQARPRPAWSPGPRRPVWEVSEFFSILKGRHPAKWREAVTEFVAEVSRRIDLPKEDDSFEAILSRPSGTGVSPFGLTVSAYRQARESEVRPKDAGAKRALWIQIREEYGTFVDRLSPQGLLRHKEKVERSGLGFEYYLTPRWLAFDGVGEPAEPARDAQGNAIVPPHPKIQHMQTRVAARWVRAVG